MGNSNFSAKIMSKPRHIRYMFLVDETYSLSDLKKLFKQNQQFWGGAYNPIIPVVNNTITEEYAQFIKHFDPDYIYYSKDISVDLLYSLDKNPLEFKEISLANNLKGININQIIPELHIDTPLIQPSGLYNAGSDLLGFYEINYCCYEEEYGSERFLKNKDRILIDEKNFTEINKLIVENRIFNKNDLHTYSDSAWTLKNDNYSGSKPSLIISRGSGEVVDFIRYWNHKFYSKYSGQKFQIIVTENELEELKLDEYFFQLLYELSDSGALKVGSATLNNEELIGIIDSCLKPKSKGFIKYEVDSQPFPYSTDGRENAVKSGFIKAAKENLFLTKQVHITDTFPDFIKELYGPNTGWMIDLELFSKEGWNFNESLLPTKTSLIFIFKMPSRIASTKRTTLLANSQYNKIEFEFPKLKSLINLRVIEPVINGKKNKTGIKLLRTNTDGKKLATFKRMLTPFNNGLDILDDKFLFDFFYDKSANSRLEGDTFTFNEFINLCIEKMNEEGIELTERGYLKHSNVSSSLKNLFQNLIDNNIIRVGMRFRCSNCFSNYWYHIDSINSNLNCTGCDSPLKIIAETPISYKLNDVIKRNLAELNTSNGKISPNGNFVVFLTHLKLSFKSRISYEYHEQLDYFTGRRPYTKPNGDLDIVAISDGQFIIGEAKHHVRLFNEKKKKSLIAISEAALMILPDVVVLSCYEGTEATLTSCVNFVKGRLQGTDIKVEGIKLSKPAYNFDSYTYFND